MNDQHDTHDGREPYPWTARWEPLLSPEEVRLARCDDCGERARYVRFTGPGGRSDSPRDGNVTALFMCESSPSHDCTGAAAIGGYGDLELAELADAVEGPDWAQHLAEKLWWRGAGAAALLARFGRPAPANLTDPLVELREVAERADLYARRMTNLTFVAGFHGLADGIALRTAASRAALTLAAVLDRAEESERIARETGRIG
jgi:hypothetical protein